MGPIVWATYFFQRQSGNRVNLPTSIVLQHNTVVYTAPFTKLCISDIGTVPVCFSLRLVCVVWAVVGKYYRVPVTLCNLQDTDLWSLMLPWTCSENEPHYDLVVPISFSVRCLIMIGQAPGMVVCLIAGTIVIQCTLVTFDLSSIII